MTSQSLKKYYVWAIKALVFVIPFLSLWIAYSMYFPYITGRNFAFRILVELALALWLALAVLDKEYRPRMTPIAWAVLAFTFITGLADFLGVNPALSFWSRLERMEGFMMILHLCAYFFVLTNVFRGKKDWNQFFNLVVIAGILVGGYGILQVMGVEKAIQGGGVRIDGTIGNPTYLAAYLTLVIAIAMVLFFSAEKRWQKYYYGAVIAFELFVMFFTASRGATFGFLVAIPLFAILYLIFYRNADGKEKLFKKLAIAVLILAIVVPLGVWLLKNTSVVQNSTVLSRLTSLNFQEHTIKSRFQIWQIAWHAFLARPVLGWGQENFLQAFSQYYDPRLFDQEPWFDRPHNIVFEWLIDGGVFGLAAYCSLFITLFWGIRKLMKSGAIGKKEALVLIVMPVAYFIQNFFVFDNFNTYYLFFAFLAYVSALVAHSRPRTAEHSKETAGRLPASHIALVAGLVVTFGVAYMANIRPMAQAQGIISALEATTGNVDPVGNTLTAFKGALSYDTFANSETLEQLTRTASLLVNQQNIPNSIKIPFLQYTIEQMSAYLDSHPSDIRLHLMMGSFYESLRNLNPAFISKARTEIQTALDLSPKKQQILFLLADNYLIGGDANKALELLQKAADLEPKDADAEVNLAIVGAIANRNDVIVKALQELDVIRKTVPVPNVPNGALWAYVQSLSKIGNGFAQIGQKHDAENVYAMLLSLKQEALAMDITPEAYQNILNNLAAQIQK